MPNKTTIDKVTLGINPTDFEAMEREIKARAIASHHPNAKPLTKEQEEIIRKYWRAPGVNKEEVSRIIGLSYETVKKHAFRMGV